MKKLLTLTAAILASATLLLATAPAQAGPVHVDLNIGVPLPLYVAPTPVYAQPQPVYVQPREVLVYGNPGYYAYQQPWHDHEWHERHDWHDQRWNNREYHDNHHVAHDDHHEHHDGDHGWH